MKIDSKRNEKKLLAPGLSIQGKQLNTNDVVKIKKHSHTKRGLPAGYVTLANEAKQERLNKYLKSIAMKGIKCDPGRRCKNNGCDTCFNKRLRYFADKGSDYCEIHKLNTWVTIAWPLGKTKKMKGMISKFDHWDIFGRVLPMLAKLMSNRARIGKHIKCLGVGDVKDCPHIHLVMTEKAANWLTNRCLKLFKDHVTTQTKPVTYPYGLMIYLMENNYRPLSINPDRPKRFRILGGSRGLCYGYPTAVVFRKAETLNKIHSIGSEAVYEH
jgi:hypothetical protein